MSTRHKRPRPGRKAGTPRFRGCRSARSAEQAGPETAGCGDNLTAPENSTRPQPGYLPVTAVIEILSGEYEAGITGEALCRTAVRVAGEGGVLEKFRSGWDAEAEAPGRKSPLLDDRRRSLELLRYYKSKGDPAAVKRTEGELALTEGRLLLEKPVPLKISDGDLERLENFIKEYGF
jgi:hypothetical protein